MHQLDEIFRLLYTAFENWQSSHIGRIARLPQHTLEIELPQSVLGNDASGWCLDISKAYENITEMVANAKNTKALKHAARAAQLVNNCGEDKQLIIMISDLSHIKNPVDRAFRKNLTRNHERTHAALMFRNKLWFRSIDTYMHSMVGDHWASFTEKICNIAPYNKFISKNKELVVWYAVQESFARIGAVLHAPSNKRKIAIRSEASWAEPELTAMVDFIENSCGSIEHFVGWYDQWVQIMLTNEQERGCIMGPANDSCVFPEGPE